MWVGGVDTRGHLVASSGRPKHLMKRLVRHKKTVQQISIFAAMATATGNGAGSDSGTQLPAPSTSEINGEILAQSGRQQLHLVALY